MADTATPAVALSTAVVPPQARGFDSERVKTLFVKFGAASEQINVAFPNKVQIVDVRYTNGATAQATATNTTAINIDSEDGAGTKVADIAAKAAATALAADATSSLTVSSTQADNIIETTEILRIDQTIQGTQTSSVLSISYVDLAVPNYTVTW